MSRECLIRLTAMGDILLAIPAARALAAAGKTVHWVISSKWAGLLPFLPAQVHLLSGVSSLAGVWRDLNNAGVSRVHDLQGKLISVALSAALAVETRRYGKRPLREAVRASLGLYPLLPSDTRPVWQRYLDTVGCAGAAPDGEIVRPEWFERETRALLDSLGLGFDGYFVVHSQASHAPKVIPEQGVREIARILPLPTVLVGGQHQPNTCGAAVNLAGKLDLRQLPQVLAGARAVITSDSGPMHLARAVSRPTAAFFTQTDPCLGFAPIPAGNVRVYSRPLNCKPCSLHGNRLSCPLKTRDCMDFSWRDCIEDFLITLEQL